MRWRGERLPAGSRLRAPIVLLGFAAVLSAAVLGVSIGPVALPPLAVATELIDHVPGVNLRSGLDPREAAIVWQLRFPRVVLGLLVGATLALAGACYQGVFRNPLADPYLLGVAAGAGLGATIAVVFAARPEIGGFRIVVPAMAFAGALSAVALTYGLATTGSVRRSPATLILAGVAVASFFTAVQTYVQQRHTEVLQVVYSWILGRLSTSGWAEVTLLAPYTAITVIMAISYRRALDVMSVGDDEASSLGLHPGRIRLVLVVFASLGTAAAVAVSGLIGFVGLVVPHAVRLVFGTSYRVVLPLTPLFGAAFLALADLIGRSALAPTEIPIGVVTAFVGAPFFALILRTSGRAGT